MKAPLVSVVMPVKNGQKYIYRSINSILKGTYQNFEFIVIDDHSTDNTLHILNEYSKKDSRIKVLQNMGTGIVDALNTGIRHASGAFIARMDVDDISMPFRLQHQVEYLQANPEVDFLSGKVYCFPRETLSGWYLWYEALINLTLSYEDIKRAALIDLPVPHPTWMIRRNLFEKVGMYRNGPFPEDYDLFLRSLLKGIKVAKLDEIILWWQDKPERTSRTDRRYSVSGHVMVKAMYIKEATTDKRIVVMGAGRTAKELIKGLRSVGMDVGLILDVNKKRFNSTLKGVPIQDVTKWIYEEDQFILIAIRSKVGSHMIAQSLKRMGLKEGENFLIVA